MATKNEKEDKEVKEEKVKKPRKPKKDVEVVPEVITHEVVEPVVVTPPVVEDDSKIPESGKNDIPPTAEVTERQRIFDMKMDVVYRGVIYIKGINSLPQESKDYLKQRGWEKE